jgi:predicted alpha/beta hydrolase family esterase
MQLDAFLSQQDESSPSLETSLAETSVLVVPGWNGSGVGHWQTIWEQKYPRFRRVEQHNWTRPSRTNWIAQIDGDIDCHNMDRHNIDRVGSPTFLVAHSLGCLAVAHWAAAAGKKTDQVDGAFLVAPPWLTESEQCPAQLTDFLPMPLQRLPFPSLFVASEDDPYLPIEIAGRLASAWGSQFVDIGTQGHINVASGHGPWPVGEGLLRGFVARTVGRC